MKERWEETYRLARKAEATALAAWLIAVQDRAKAERRLGLGRIPHTELWGIDKDRYCENNRLSGNDPRLGGTKR